MIDDILIFDNIISDTDANFLLNFSQTNKNNFELLENTIRNGKKDNLKPYPGKVIMIKTDDRIQTKNLELYDILHKIELNICKKLDIQFLKSYRQQINCLEPLGREYNKLELIHWDTIVQHYVIVYYINDSDGDTCIYTNKNGNNANEFAKTYSSDGLQTDSFELIKSIQPKKGRALVFNGKYPHAASYPNNGDRFVVNINFIGSEYKKNKSFI